MTYQTDTAIFDDAQKLELFREIGKNITKIRQRQNLTKSDLAKMANVTTSTLVRIENGESHSGSCLINAMIALKADVKEVIPLRSYLGMESNSERFEHLTDSLDSYEMNSLFRIIEMYVNSVKRKEKGGMAWTAQQN